MGTKDSTIGTLSPIHKELNFVYYALEISQCINLKNIPRLGVKYVHNYLRAAVSHATDNGKRDPHLWYTTSGLPLDGAKPLPMLRKLFSHMCKWEEGRDEALPLMTAILRALEARS